MIHIGDDGTPTKPGQPVNSLNLACSGAQTGTFTESGAFKPGIDFYNAGPGQQGQAFMLQEFAKLNDVRMVVVSIGGNDFGFGTVIQTCVEDFLVYFSYCSQDAKVTDRADPANIKAVSDKITAALGNVRQAMRVAGRSDDSWTLVFNLNPDPLVLGDGFRYGEHLSRQDPGGCGVYDTDASWAGTTFIGAVRQAQQDAVQAAGIPRSVLLDLGNWLDDRKLCSTTTSLVGSSGGAPTWQSAGAVDSSEWANQIHLDTIDGPYFQQESLHPNYWAQLAARSCLRQVFDGGTPTGGTCVRSGDGLTSRGEPVMTLQQRFFALGAEGDSVRRGAPDVHAVADREGVEEGFRCLPGQVDAAVRLVGEAALVEGDPVVEEDRVRHRGVVEDARLVVLVPPEHREHAGARSVALPS